MDSYLITGFTFMSTESGHLTAVEFRYEDDASASVCFPTEALAQVDKELTASLERNVQRAAARPSNWPLQVVGRKTAASGPEYEVIAARTTSVELFERLDGERITIVFSHADIDPMSLIHSRRRIARGGYDGEDGYEGATNDARASSLHGRI